MKPGKVFSDCFFHRYTEKSLPSLNEDVVEYLSHLLEFDVVWGDDTYEIIENLDEDLRKVIFWSVGDAL